MATIAFYIDPGLGDGDFNIDSGGSAIGFYGAGGFGASVAVGSYQENTYSTDSNGAVQGPQANNVKWTHANSGEISGSTNLNLLDIPNANATMNIRFTHTSDVQVQNAELLIYDRTTTTSAASGVTTQAYQCLHPSTSQSGSLGSGAATWTECDGSGSSTGISLAQSPGTSGLNAGNGSTSTTADDRHDWYVCLSASPDSIGSKTQYGMYFSLEYL